MAQSVADRRSSAVKDFLKTILLLELWVGLWVTLKNQFRPHITVEYPKESVELSPRFRGVPRLRFHPESGEELCIACHLCETVCPDDCIHIVSEKKPDGKGKRLVSFEINYERCCFCGLCVDPCPTKPLTAIYMSHDYEMADYRRDRFVAPLNVLLGGVELPFGVRESAPVEMDLPHEKPRQGVARMRPGEGPQTGDRFRVVAAVDRRERRAHADRLGVIPQPHLDAADGTEEEWGRRVLGQRRAQMTQSVLVALLILAAADQRQKKACVGVEIGAG